MTQDAVTDLVRFCLILSGVVGLFWLLSLVAGLKGLIETWRGGRGR